MPPATPPLEFDHEPGQEIPTKHKETIRQFYSFAKIPIESLMTQYKLGKSIITKILIYNTPECSRITRTGRPFFLTDIQVDQIIEYAAKYWEHRILDYSLLHTELKLKCSIETLEKKLKQKDYFRYIAYQKPYLIIVQVLVRFLWAIAYIFWIIEWLKVLWSDEVTFQIGG